MPKLLHCFNCCLFIYDNKYTAHSMCQKRMCQDGPHYLRKASKRSPFAVLLNPSTVGHILGYTTSYLRTLQGTAVMLWASFSLGPALTRVLSSAQTTLDILPSPHAQIPPTFHDAHPILPNKSVSW